MAEPQQLVLRTQMSGRAAAAPLLGLLSCWLLLRLWEGELAAPPQVRPT